MDDMTTLQYYWENCSYSTTIQFRVTGSVFVKEKVNMNVYCFYGTNHKLHCRLNSKNDSNSNSNSDSNCKSFLLFF